MSSTTFTPGPTPNTIKSANGKVLTAPVGWVLLPPSDVAMTRKVTAARDYWVVQVKNCNYGRPERIRSF